MVLLPDGVLDGFGSGQVQLIGAEIRSIAGGWIFGMLEDWKFDVVDWLIGYWQIVFWLLIIVVGLLLVVLVVFVRKTVAVDFCVWQRVEVIILGLMIFCAVVVIFITIGIVFVLTYEILKFFSMVPIIEFLFGISWEL